MKLNDVRDSNIAVNMDSGVQSKISSSCTVYPISINAKVEDDYRITVNDNTKETTTNDLPIDQSTINSNIQYTYLVAFIGEVFVPISRSVDHGRIGQMKREIYREIIHLPFQIRNEDDVSKAENIMKEKGLNVIEIIAISKLES